MHWMSSVRLAIESLLLVLLLLIMCIGGMEILLALIVKWMLMEGFNVGVPFIYTVYETSLVGLSVCQLASNLEVSCTDKSHHLSIQSRTDLSDGSNVFTVL